MRILAKMLKQTAVYWPLDTYDSDGFPTYDTPVQIRCRWEDVREEFVGPAGTRLLSRAKVYVDRDVTEGGVLWLGTLAACGDLADPKANDAAWEIRRFEKLPTLKAKAYLRTALL